VNWGRRRLELGKGRQQGKDEKINNEKKWGKMGLRM
jgi:hypothetical protein